jgi:hypothetical protein
LTAEFIPGWGSWVQGEYTGIPVIRIMWLPAGFGVLKGVEKDGITLMNNAVTIY